MKLHELWWTNVAKSYEMRLVNASAFAFQSEQRSCTGHEACGHALQDEICTEGDAMQVVLSSMDPFSHAGLLLVGNMKSLVPSSSSGFGISNLSFLLKPPPTPLDIEAEISGSA